MRAEAEFYVRFSGGPVAFTRPGQPVAPAAPKLSAPGPQQVKPRPPAARGKVRRSPGSGVMTARPHQKIEDLSDEQINHIWEPRSLRIDLHVRAENLVTLSTSELRSYIPARFGGFSIQTIPKLPRRRIVAIPGRRSVSIP